MPVLTSNEQDKVPVTDELLTLIERLAALALEREDAAPTSEVSLTFTDDEGIRALNRDYRHLDQPTDVLSFPLLEQMDSEPAVVDGQQDYLLGDIVISLERAAAQAKEFGHSLEREIGFLFVHGLLHLLGYDHDTPDGEGDMREREEATLQALGLTR
ncbi:MAG: rRNA maturation RNase YbeY [Chloroflexota bacterium]